MCRKLTSKQVLLSHTSNESVPFTSSSISTSADLRTMVETMFPEASNDTVNYMLDTVWPDVLDGTYPWMTEFSRAVRLGSEAFFTCSTRYLATALGNNTWNSIFAYPPGYHAQDLAFVFFNGDVSTLVDGVAVSSEIAYAIQDHLVSFAVNGDPNYDGAAVTWPVYGSSSEVLEYSYTGISTTTDDTANSRCAWIQQAIADGTL
jgi:carboxylesterase type B